MRVGFVEWPEALEPDGPEWLKIAGDLATSQVELLITNELPFGPWIADRTPFSRETAEASVAIHDAGLDALIELALPAIVSSRPVWSADRLMNQAIAIEDGRVRAIHTKQFFPEEPGWYEASWYEPGKKRFEPTEVLGVGLGVMLCTDAMFNEHARKYGRQGTSLIAVPRAAGTQTDNWLIACRMAALVSGSYVISSNRYGRSANGTVFGGAGFAIGPDGALLATTDSAHPLLTVDVHPEIAARQKSEYPNYVSERGL